MTRSKRQTVMDKKDREYIEFSRPIQQKVIQRLLAIIDRLEDECQIREYQKNAWQRENASLRDELEEAKSDAMKEIKQSVFLSKQCDTLKSQLLALKKVGEPFMKVAHRYPPIGNRAGMIIQVCKDKPDFTFGELRRLAEKLDEVEDE